MGRPKSSVVGLLDLAAQGYNITQARKTRIAVEGTSNELQTLKANADTSIALQLVALDGLRTLHDKMVVINSNLSSVFELLARRDANVERLGDLKIELIMIERELDELEKLFLDFPAFATLKAEALKETVEGLGLTIRDFKYMESPDDIKWADGILKRAINTFDSFIRRMGERE